MIASKENLKIEEDIVFSSYRKRGAQRKLEGEPELTCTLAFYEIQKIVKLYEKFGKTLGAYVYKFFTLVIFSRIK